MGEESLIPLDDMRNGGSGLLVEDESQEESDGSEQANVSNADLIASQVVSLGELSLNNLKSLEVVLLSSLVLLLGELGVVSKGSVNSPHVVGGQLGVLVFEPLVDLCALSGAVSVVFSGLSGKEPQDGSGFVDAAFLSLKGGDLAERVLGEIFGSLELVPGDSDELDGDVDEAEEELLQGLPDTF